MHAGTNARTDTVNNNNNVIRMNTNPVYGANTDGTGDVEMQTCDAYETTKHNSEVEQDSTYSCIDD